MQQRYILVTMRKSTGDFLFCQTENVDQTIDFVRNTIKQASSDQAATTMTAHMYEQYKHFVNVDDDDISFDVYKQNPDMTVSKVADYK